jgi:hypothetical protein
MRVLIEWFHWHDVQWVKYEQNVGVDIFEDGVQVRPSVVVSPVVSTSQTGPLLFVRCADNRLL